jgi:hypothetical protein
MDLRAQLQSAVAHIYATAVSTDRFRQEIRLAARLQHPHIVPLHSAGEAHGLLYYTRGGLVTDLRSDMHRPQAALSDRYVSSARAARAA